MIDYNIIIVMRKCFLSSGKKQIRRILKAQREDFLRGRLVQASDGLNGSPYSNHSKNMLGNISREFWLENFFASWPRARVAFSKESWDCWKLMKRVTYPTNQKKKLGHLIIISSSSSIFSLYTSASLSPSKGYLLHH